jgi:hypothetical protein
MYGACGDVSKNERSPSTSNGLDARKFPTLVKLGVTSTNNIAEAICQIKSPEKITLTNGLILELSSLLTKSPYGMADSKEISKADFSFFIIKVLQIEVPSEQLKNFRKRVTKEPTLNTLLSKVQSNKLDSNAEWHQCQKLIQEYPKSQNQTTDPHESEDQIVDIQSGKAGSSTECMDCIASMKSGDEADGADLMDTTSIYFTTTQMEENNLLPDATGTLEKKLENWRPSKDTLTNGLVYELWNTNIPFKKINLLKKICTLARIDHSWLDKKLTTYLHRLCNATDGTCHRDRWIYLDELCVGGRRHQKEWLYSTKHKEFNDFIMHLNKKLKEDCMNCGNLAGQFELKLCKGCLNAVYCSKTCASNNWLEGGHSNECISLANAELMKFAVEPPRNYQYSSIYGKYMKSFQMISQLHEDMLELEVENQEKADEAATLLEELQRKTHQLNSKEEEFEKLKQAKQRLQKQKAGLVSGLKKCQQKLKAPRQNEEGVDTDYDVFEEDEVSSDKECDTGEHFIKFERAIHVGSGVLDAFYGRELNKVTRAYGVSTFVKLKSSRGIKNEVQQRTLQNRARQMWEFGLLCTGADDSVSDKATLDCHLQQLLAELIKQHSGDFERLISSNTKVLDKLLKMTPLQTSELMSACNFSFSQKRRLATIMGSIFGFNPLASEVKQRAYEKERTNIVSREKIEAGKMLLFKTAKSENATTCAFVRHKNVCQFLTEIHKFALDTKCNDSDILNLDHPHYGGKIWVILKGDKGSHLMKFSLSISAHAPHIWGMFEAADTVSNLMTFQQPYYEQLRNLQDFGIEVKQRDGSTVKKDIELFLGGDKAFIYAENGTAGASATFPSTYTYRELRHLRTAHRDGSPHTASSCGVEWRTVEKNDRDYHANLQDQRNKGSTRKNGKYHHSVVSPRLIPLKTCLHNIVSSLHIALGVTVNQVDFMEHDCDLLDGTKSPHSRSEVIDIDQEDVIPGGEEEFEEEIDEDYDEPRLQEIFPETSLMRANQEARKMLELEWEKKSGELSESKYKEISFSALVMDKEIQRQRLIWAKEGNKTMLEKQAKKDFGSRTADKEFGKWGEDWKCGTCTLTKFDRNIQWVECNVCFKWVHLYCQFYVEDQLAEIHNSFFKCRECHGSSTEDIIAELDEELRKIHHETLKHAAAVAYLEAEASELKEKCTNYMGKLRKEFQSKLESLGVERNAYHSRSLVVEKSL